MSGNKGGRWIGRPAGGLHSKRHAVCDGTGRPLRIALTAGPRSEYDGARLLFADLPAAKQVLAEKGDDIAWFRDAFAPRTIRVCIPARAKGSHPARHAVRLSQQRHTIEHMFGRLTDWRRLALRSHRRLCHVSCRDGYFVALIDESGP